jgi:hypothetical protein
MKARVRGRNYVYLRETPLYSLGCREAKGIVSKQLIPEA